MMINHILLSLLSISMIAHTAYGASQDNTETPSYFHFRKGTVHNNNNAEFRPLFWPAWASQTTCSPDDAKAAAFIKRMQDLSQESRSAAKKGAQKGFVTGGICGAVVGALVAGLETASNTPMPNDQSTNNKNFKYYAECVAKKGLQLLIGAAIGTVIGGTIGAIVNAPIKAYKILNGSGFYNCSYLQRYSDDARQHALYKLIDTPGISSEAKAIIKKIYWAEFTRDKITLSDKENRILDESTIAFGSTALFEEERMIKPCIETTSIKNVLQELENTHKQHQDRIYAITNGSGMAGTYARKNKWNTFMSAGKNISTLRKLFNDLEKQRATENISIQRVLPS